MNSVQRRVMIADDDGMLREIATGMLERAGFAVVTAASGRSAVAACAAEMPDIVLLDVEMSEGDGYEACAGIRALPNSAHVPIVMITGHDDPDSISHAYQAGATDFMIKPINWTLLVRRIEYVLRGARTLDALRHSEEKNAALLKVMPYGIFLVNARGAILQRLSTPHASPEPRQAGFTEQGQLADFLPPSVRGIAAEHLAIAARGSVSVFDFPLASRDRGVRHFECQLLPKSADEMVAVLRDVTRHKDNESRMRRLAYVDALTGLPNREWIKSYLNKALTRAEKNRTSCAVLFVDLDGFKQVNDTLGHEAGDALLAQVAGRLRSALGHESPARGRRERLMAVSSKVSRLGGDEFLALLTGSVSVEEAERAAQRIREELNVKFAIAGCEVSITPSIGIALSPQHGRDAKTIMKSADEAMYLAKSGGRNQYRFYDDTLRARAALRTSLEQDLRGALGTAQLEVLYRPEYDSRTLAICGAESSVRWMHPTRGEIPRADFLAVAEDTGLISDLDAWTFERACADLTDWRKQGINLKHLSLRISAREFLRPDLPQRLGFAAERVDIPAATFELEIGEAVLMRDASLARRALDALKKIGFRLAIDDFGTGQCSFSCLRHLPLDTLKIAGSLVEEIARDAGNLAIVRAIIALSRKLELQVVAKGVSTIAQLQFLRAEQCDLVQGFLLSPAVSAERFEMLVRSTGPSTQTVRALQLASGSTGEQAAIEAGLIKASAGGR